MPKLNQIPLVCLVIFLLALQSCDEQSIVTTNAISKERAQLSNITSQSNLEISSKSVFLSSRIIKEKESLLIDSEINYTIKNALKGTISFSEGVALNPETIVLKDISNVPILLAPEFVKAKEMAAKQFNIASITYFDKLQGLKQSFVASLLKDDYGNLWFGTHGGGVTRYDGKYFTHFTEKEGLAGNSVFSMLQAKDQKIWFGTFGKGLSIFDGASFRNISTKNGFASDNIYSIFEDRKGIIWVSTEGGGLVSIDTKKTENIKVFNSKNGFIGDEITAILEDHKGAIWVGSVGNGFAKIENGRVIVPKNESFSKLIVSDIIQDKQGSIWVSTYSNGLFKIEGQNVWEYNTKNGFPSDLLTTLEIDSFSNLWVATDDIGVVKITDYKSPNLVYSTINTDSGLSSNSAYSFVQDNQGHMWIGTNRGGVNKLNGNNFTQILDKSIFSFTQDKDKNVWVSTNEDGIIKYELDKSNNSWAIKQNITTSEGLSHDRVNQGLRDHLGKLWFGTNNGISIIDGKNISILDEKSGLCGKRVLSVFQDKNKHYWFGMNSGEGIATFDGKKITCIKGTNNLFNSAIYTIEEDSEGRLWFGTESEGIIIKDKSEYYKFSEDLPFMKNAIFSIKKDAEGFIWIATEGHGIYCYDGKNFFNLNEKNGLSNNFVFSILEDFNGDMWFGTRFGLNVLSKKKKTEFINKITENQPINLNDAYFKSYNYEDGFLGVGCNRNAIFQSYDKSLWIGTTDRLTLSHLSKKNVATQDTNKPLNLFISKIDLFNEKVNWLDLFNKNIRSQKLDNGVNIQNVHISGLSKWYQIPDKISLRHDNNYLTFYFTAITQDQPWKVLYQYKINQIDNEWSAWSLDNSAHYSHLHPGSYTISVRAKDYHGRKSETISYSFDVRNPWWLSWWIKLFYLASLIGLIYFIHLNQKTKTIKNERLKTQAKELEHAKEIEQAYTDLKNTQVKLIQSEKLASLGELTAGIAHEIQNPLNFVNNFSDVSNEMIQEIFEERQKQPSERDEKLEEEILVDLKLNLEKISVHGKRASNIVKGMLDHSRKNTDEKSPTDINALADEYLRLAYHGLRAKDKTFNASFELKEYPNLPLVNVVRQDMGRVFLNIINNAFYAVSEKSYKKEEGYQPKVIVTTKQLDDNHIEISIQDNGSGIPETIIEKIFQPFFTTKPTGQGTGLGLSLSYDIVKAHGGELKVDSFENQGSSFIIHLPLK